MFDVQAQMKSQILNLDFQRKQSSSDLNTPAQKNMSRHFITLYAADIKLSTASNNIGNIKT